jgi:putative membrane protein
VTDPDGPDYGFAAERTYLAWTRTGLSLAATGGAVLKLFPPLVVPGARFVVGIVMIAMGAVAWLLGSWQLRAPAPASRARRLRWFSLGMSVVAAGALALGLV